MWLWVLRILVTIAAVYCHVQSWRLLERARFESVRPMTRYEFSWQMTDKLLTDEGKKLASDGRMWGVPAYALTIVCVVLWFSIR